VCVGDWLQLAAPLGLHIPLRDGCVLRAGVCLPVCDAMGEWQAIWATALNAYMACVPVDNGVPVVRDAGGGGGKAFAAWLATLKALQHCLWLLRVSVGRNVASRQDLSRPVIVTWWSRGHVGCSHDAEHCWSV
jgi:hypothetical protein